MKTLNTISPYSSTLIVVGLGYEAHVVESAVSTSIDFKKLRYLSIRVGHSFQWYTSIPDSIGIKISKKRRKVLVYSLAKTATQSFSKFLNRLKYPNIYTGNGVREKGVFYRRKKGKVEKR